jgi:hypothetical protein
MPMVRSATQSGVSFELASLAILRGSINLAMVSAVLRNESRSE